MVARIIATVNYYYKLVYERLKDLLLACNCLPNKRKAHFLTVQLSPKAEALAEEIVRISIFTFTVVNDHNKI